MPKRPTSLYRQKPTVELRPLCQCKDRQPLSNEKDHLGRRVVIHHTKEYRGQFGTIVAVYQCVQAEIKQVLFTVELSECYLDGVSWMDFLPAERRNQFQ